MRIQNIRVIDPANNRDEVSDIFVADGKIASESEYERLYCKSGDECIDGTGLVAGPGLVDVHVHFRDPGQTHKEDIHTGSMAAAAGGVTSVVMMANTTPPIDSPELVRAVLQKAANEDIHISTCATVTKGMSGKELCDYDALIAAGAVGFTDDGKPITDEALLRTAFNKISELNVPVSLHEEDPAYISENGINSGAAAAALGLSGSRRRAEISMVERDLAIAAGTRIKLDIQHISTAEAINAVRNAKRTNPYIHAEATPHHFTLTDADVAKYGTNAKMNPPLRGEGDRKAIWEGLADGTIDMIATDHAPHSPEEKARDFVEAPSGIIGLETSFILAYEVLVKGGIINLSELFRLMSLNPARLYDLPAGSLSTGAVADIMIFSPHEVTDYTTSRSKSCNSPFLGRTIAGKIKYTIAAGKVIYSA